MSRTVDIVEQQSTYISYIIASFRTVRVGRIMVMTIYSKNDVGEEGNARGFGIYRRYGYYV
jgi:hypothetical protein